MLQFQTNKAISKIIGNQPAIDPVLEVLFVNYCNSLGIEPNKKGSTSEAPRKYWRLILENDFDSNVQTDGEFPEGKIAERLHKLRERNSEVVKLAKLNFKHKHGKVFCQACNFDFENVYGELGVDFIEGHHTIAVSDMAVGHKTKVEDIVLLCSNCHRMIHTKKPWLNMDQLLQLIKQSS